MTGYKSSNVLGRSVLAVVFLAVFSGGISVVHAQTPQPPYALMEYSALTGSGNTITATQVPVVTTTGVTVYVNLALQFNVDANGNLTVSPGYPQVIPAPIILSSGFKAGTYVGPSTVLSGKAAVVVSGPGVTDGGATNWSLSAAGGADACTFPNTASWYVGPIANNPYAARLKAAGITSTAWSYGIFGGPNCTIASAVFNGWYPGTLIGVSQIGSTLTIASFSRGGTSDSGVPVDQITYTLKP
jgi:hypothetical protein